MDFLVVYLRWMKPERLWAHLNRPVVKTRMPAVQEHGFEEVWQIVHNAPDDYRHNNASIELLLANHCSPAFRRNYL